MFKKKIWERLIILGKKVVKMKNKLKVVDSAFKGVAYFLRSKHNNFYFFQLFNRGKHALFTPPVTTALPSYYVVFKRDFFFSFAKQFFEFVKEFPEFNTVGESINEEFLETALKFGVDYLLFVYDNGKVYKVSPFVVKRFCEKHKLVRLQDKTTRIIKDGYRQAIREKTYSFPITLLERFGDL